MTTVVPEWDFADRLRKARLTYALLTKNRVTQAAFAALIGVTVKRYENWESGANEPDNIVGVAEAIERATGIPAAWVLTGRYEGDAPRLSREHATAGQGPFSGSDIDSFLDAIEAPATVTAA